MPVLPNRAALPALTCAAGFVLAVLLLTSRTGAQDKKPAAIRSKVVTRADARSTKGPWGEMRVHFNGDETFANQAAFAAIAVVEPGQAVHLAHRHVEEEFLFLTEGSGTWHLDGREFPAHKGDVLYVEPWVFHGLRNTSDKPLTFAVVKYQPKGVKGPPRPDDRKDEVDRP
ncbi:MAG: cupin domain-containing protein [Phycisphaerae bacterium]|jgi:mannose-6-phosphate isomerase-like protein (cupin superfamily)